MKRAALRLVAHSVDAAQLLDVKVRHVASCKAIAGPLLPILRNPAGVAVRSTGSRLEAGNYDSPGPPRHPPVAGEPLVNRAPAHPKRPGHPADFFTFPDALNHKASSKDRGSGILMRVVHPELLPET